MYTTPFIWSFYISFITNSKMAYHLVAFRVINYQLPHEGSSQYLMVERKGKTLASSYLQTKRYGYKQWALAMKECNMLQTIDSKGGDLLRCYKWLVEPLKDLQVWWRQDNSHKKVYRLQQGNTKSIEGTANLWRVAIFGIFFPVLFFSIFLLYFLGLAYYRMVGSFLDNKPLPPPLLFI